MLGNSHDGADALQDAMLTIVRKLDRFDDHSAFGTWAYRLTANVCLDELRRRKRRPAPDDALPVPSVDAIEGGVVDRTVVEAALAALPEVYRSAVVLRDLLGYDYAEIAEVIGVPVGTVRSRIARGRATLASAIGNPATPDERPTT